MRNARLASQRLFVQFVKRRQAKGEQFTEDDALGNAVSQTATKLHRQVLQAFGNAGLVSGGKMGKPVSHHDPVEQRIVDGMAVAARLAHHLRIMGNLDDLAGRRINPAQNVEIDVGIVQRSDQRVSHGMGKPHQVTVMSRRVDDDEIVFVFNALHDLGETAQFFRFVFEGAVMATADQMVMGGMGNGKLVLARPVAAVFEIARQAQLPRIEIDARNSMTAVEQMDDDVHRRGRLARAALLVAADNDICLPAAGSATCDCIRIHALSLTKKSQLPDLLLNKSHGFASETTGIRKIVSLWLRRLRLRRGRKQQQKRRRQSRPSSASSLRRPGGSSVIPPPPERSAGASSGFR